MIMFNCPQCRAINQSWSKFCNHCGTSFVLLPSQEKHKPKENIQVDLVTTVTIIVLVAFIGLIALFGMVGLFQQPSN